MSKTKITGRFIIAHDGKDHTILEGGELVYSGNEILFTGYDYPEAVDATIDVGNAVVGPGFVDLDALADLDSTVLSFDNTPGWKKGRVWADSYMQSGPREVYTAEEEDFKKRYAFTQLLLNGITTALPITSLLYREWDETYDEFSRAVEIAAELGIRAYLGPAYRTGASVVSRDGKFSTHWNEERGYEGLRRAVEFARRFDGSHGGLIRTMLAPDRIECCTLELLKRTKEAGLELGIPVRLHCCQSELEVNAVNAQFGKTSIELLKDLGFLGPRTILPHGQHFGGPSPDREQIERELEWIGQSESTVVHCPVVTGRSAGFRLPYSRLKAHRVNVGMGTDTYPPDMIRNMHMGVVLNRVLEQDPSAASAADYYRAATTGGADAIGRSDLGRLAPGARADITVFDLSGFHMGQLIDPIQTMLLNGTGRDFQMVIVNGRTLVKDRKIANVDFQELHEKAQEQYDKLRASYPERSHLHPPVEEIFHPSFPLVRK